MKHIKYLRRLIVVAIISSIFGIVFDWKGFIVGVFSGLVGAVIGIWISVEIVEYLIERQRARAWHRARGAVIKYLAMQLTEIAAEYLIFVPVLAPYEGIFRGIDVITDDKLQSVNSLYDTLLNVNIDIINKGQLLAIHDTVYSRIALLRDIQMNELVLPGNAPGLVEALQELEYIATRWHEVVLLDKKKGISKDAIFEACVDTLGAVRKPMKWLMDHAY